MWHRLLVLGLGAEVDPLPVWAEIREGFSSGLSYTPPWRRLSSSTSLIRRIGAEGKNHRLRRNIFRDDRFVSGLSALVAPTARVVMKQLENEGGEERPLLRMPECEARGLKPP
jgi:hypothetical protein